MASTAQLTFLLACAFFGGIACSPVPTTSSCSKPCNWTTWFNVYRPTNETTSGDFETLDNIRGVGYKVCQKPRDIECRSVYYPYVPFGQLYHNTQCDVNKGLTCYNTENSTCLDYEVRLFCCPCDEVAVPPTTLPDDPPCNNPTCAWSVWFNFHRPTYGPDGGDFESLEVVRANDNSVCRSPKAVNCRLASFPYVPFEQLYYKHECGVNNSLLCMNKHNKRTCLDYEIQFLCCACNSNQISTTTAATTGSKHGNYQELGHGKGGLTTSAKHLTVKNSLVTVLMTSSSYSKPPPTISTNYFQHEITEDDVSSSDMELENL